MVTHSIFNFRERQVTGIDMLTCPDFYIYTGQVGCVSRQVALLNIARTCASGGFLGPITFIPIAISTRSPAEGQVAGIPWDNSLQFIIIICGWIISIDVGSPTRLYDHLVYWVRICCPVEPDIICPALAPDVPNIDFIAICCKEHATLCAASANPDGEWKFFKVNASSLTLQPGWVTRPPFNFFDSWGFPSPPGGSGKGPGPLPASTGATKIASSIRTKTNLPKFFLFMLLPLSIV